MAGSGGLGSVFAFVFSLVAGVVGVVVCIWLAVVLPRRRKLASLGFAATIALVVLASPKMGGHWAPEAVARRNAEEIVRALEAYHAAFDAYPAALDELAPAYFVTLPEAVTTQGTGWLYQSTGAAYALGYWSWPDKFGVLLCVFSSEGEGWECRSTWGNDGWEPFEPVYTPQPGRH